ncbi:MAG: UDP-N-acetylglucosamine--N-acetylmuramyl-(pentapeptide) pyrophosphoryl-undecaprenol N-acetylglucosamine transferase [Acidimicrobiales bacterium]
MTSAGSAGSTPGSEVASRAAPEAPPASSRIFAVLTGGGTAGHVQPALAIAEALVAGGHDKASVHFVGSKRGMEGFLVPEAGFSLDRLPGRGIERRLVLSNLGALGGLALASLRAWAVLRRARPEVVISLGGYAGLPASLAALLLRIPLVVVTIDAVPGAANRLVGTFAAVNATAFEGSGLRRAEVTGCPLRAGALAADRSDTGRASARRLVGLEDGRRVVLVTGGSLGARRLNTATIELARLWRERSDVTIYHVAGERDLAEVAEAARTAGLGPSAGRAVLDYRLVGFERRLFLALSTCDLTVARAGASTVAELSVMGVPSVLVPLPGAPRDHQARNAAVLSSKGAALTLLDAECDGPRLAELIDGLLASPQRLEEMEASARSLGRAGASERIAVLAESAAKRRRG